MKNWQGGILSQFIHTWTNEHNSFTFFHQQFSLHFKLTRFFFYTFHRPCCEPLVAWSGSPPTFSHPSETLSWQTPLISEYFLLSKFFLNKYFLSKYFFNKILYDQNTFAQDWQAHVVMNTLNQSSSYERFYQNTF